LEKINEFDASCSKGKTYLGDFDSLHVRKRGFEACWTYLCGETLLIALRFPAGVPNFLDLYGVDIYGIVCRMNINHGCSSVPKLWHPAIVWGR
jgi:hypothetical protein